MVLSRALVVRRVKSLHAAAHKRMCSSSGPEVLFEERGDKGIILLNRPKVLNALNLSMIRTIYPKMKEWENSKALVVMKGVGEKAFCAGGDVKAVTDAAKTGGSLSKDFFREEYQLNCLIGTYHVPYIAIIDGITMGGGVGLSVHGAYRVATERTVFAMPEMAIGLFTDVGGSHFLPRLGGNLGTYLALTGHRLKGADVLKAGIATHLCDSSKLSEMEETLFNLKTNYPEDVTDVLDNFHKSSSLVQQAKDFSLKPYIAQIERCFSGKTVEEIVDNLNKDGSEWSQNQLSALHKGSPTSLKVNLELLHRGHQLTLMECLAMEYRLTQRFCADHDFTEGVRAVLVDRDNKPLWKPASLQEVTDDTIQRYFSLLPPEDELVI